MLYVPVRALAKAFDATVIWNGDDFTVDILMFTNDVPDEVRFTEQIIDNIVADHDHG